MKNVGENVENQNLFSYVCQYYDLVLVLAKQINHYHTYIPKFLWDEIFVNFASKITFMKI